VLMSPWVDLAGTGDSIKTKADVDPVITAAAIRVRAGDYLNGADPCDPAASPIYGSLAGLPPLLIQAGSDEILLDDAIRLAARAAHADVAVTLDVVPGVPHVFQAFAAVLDEGDAALTRAGGFLRQHRRSLVHEIIPGLCAKTCGNPLSTLRSPSMSGGCTSRLWAGRTT